jgi:hypothetical protein
MTPEQLHSIEIRLVKPSTGWRWDLSDESPAGVVLVCRVFDETSAPELAGKRFPGEPIGVLGPDGRFWGELNRMSEDPVALQVALDLVEDHYTGKLTLSEVYNKLMKLP